MGYNLEISDKATAEIADFKKTDPVSFRKITKFLEELIEHPEQGTGKPEMLKGDLSGYWSRRINKKDRLIYSINDEDIIVYVLKAKGHYFDK